MLSNFVYKLAREKGCEDKMKIIPVSVRDLQGVAKAPWSFNEELGVSDSVALTNLVLNMLSRLNSIKYSSDLKEYFTRWLTEETNSRDTKEDILGRWVSENKVRQLAEASQLKIMSSIMQKAYEKMIEIVAITSDCDYGLGDTSDILGFPVEELIQTFEDYGMTQMFETFCEGNRRGSRNTQDYSYYYPSKIAMISSDKMDKVLEELKSMEFRLVSDTLAAELSTFWSYLRALPKKSNKIVTEILNEICEGAYIIDEEELDEGETATILKEHLAEQIAKCESECDIAGGDYQEFESFSTLEIAGDYLRAIAMFRDIVSSIVSRGLSSVIGEMAMSAWEKRHLAMSAYKD